MSGCCELGKAESSNIFPALVALIFGVLLLCCPVGLQAQEGYEPEEIRFTPPEYHVGEQVELRITLRVPETVPVTVPDQLPELGWITFYGAEVVRNEAVTDIRITFASFQPGLKQLPALDFGGITLKPIKIHTVSVLDIDPPPFQNAAGPVLLPGTSFFLIFFIGLVLVVPVLLISITPKLKRALIHALAARKMKRPFERLKKSLAELNNPDREGGGDSFYSVLLYEFRLYLTDRSGRDFLSITTGEFGKRFALVVPDEGLITRVSDLFGRGDGTRFGGRDMVDGEDTDALETVETAALRVESLLEEERRRRGKVD